MSSKFMKSAAVLGTVTLASLLLVACGSKPAEKAADAGSSAGKEITLYVEDQYKAFAETVAKAYEKESGTKVNIKSGDQLGGLDKLSSYYILIFSSPIKFPLNHAIVSLQLFLNRNLHDYIFLFYYTNNFRN